MYRKWEITEGHPDGLAKCDRLSWEEKVLESEAEV